MKICLVTVASDNKRGFGSFFQSCFAKGLFPTVLGMWEPYHRNSDKIVFLNEFLERDLDATHILFSDAYDVLMVGKADEIEEKFLRLKSPIVFSAERNCWPDKTLENQYPPCETPYRFLNSGLWMAEINMARMMCNRALREPMHESDQLIFSQIFLAGDILAVLDHKCSLFQSLNGSSQDLMPENGRFKNVLTGEFPVFLHANGKCDMPVVEKSSWCATVIM